MLGIDLVTFCGLKTALGKAYWAVHVTQKNFVELSHPPPLPYVRASKMAGGY